MNREPLLSRASIASAITLLAGLAAVVGVNVSTDDQNTLVSAVVAVLAAVSVIGHMVAAWRARKHTTPTVDPRADDGTILVPAAVAPTEAFHDTDGAVDIVDPSIALSHLNPGQED